MAEKIKIELKGKPLVPRELTIREIESLIENLDGTLHPIEAMFPDEPVPATAAAMSVGVQPDDLLDLQASMVEELLHQVKDKNPFLVRAVETLAAVGRQIQAEDSKTSAVPSAD